MGQYKGYQIAKRISSIRRYYRFPIKYLMLWTRDIFICELAFSFGV
jgi:hypothetical protein